MNLHLASAKQRWWPGAGIAKNALGITSLIFIHIVTCCVSLVYVAHLEYQTIDPATSYRISYDPTRLDIAVVAIAAFALVSLLFVFARFSFGYFVGFYLYTMIMDYLWINCFSILHYNHRLTELSAAVSAVLFLFPALLISSPISQTYVLSTRAFDRLLTFIQLLAIATIAVGAFYNFRLVGLRGIYDFRDKLNELPMVENYSIRITSSVLLPFAFAYFATFKNYWRAGSLLFLMLLFYPLTLTKLAAFTPAWLVFVTLLTKFFGPKTTVVLSLFFPMFAGIVVVFFGTSPSYFFHLINFRMIAVPSIAMDVYNDYFSNHNLTYFCQIRTLRPVMFCPYEDQLSIVMERAYHLGAFNASLFATEGIASIGPLFAPVSAFFCGLVIALGNRSSASLPTSFILISGALIPHILLNVPLTTVLLTHGLGLLFLLWYITPREMFEPMQSREQRERVDLTGNA